MQSSQEFIVNRMNIYASDMNILQYSVSRGRKKGEMDFGDVGHSYLVVFMKESPSIFKSSPYFIHKKLEITDTGIELNRITTIVYIELDKCLAYVKEHGLLYGREELCMLLVLMADSNSEETKALAKNNKEVGEMLIELGTMTQNREELLDMLTKKYADDIKYSEMQSARREGEKLGEERGEKRGEKRGKIEETASLVMKKVQKSKSLEVIAEELECTPEEIRYLYEAVVQCGAGCSVADVLDKIAKGS